MERVYLRALDSGDLERTHRWHNDRTLYRMMASPFRYVSQAAEAAWLEQKQAYSRREVSLAICLTEGSVHIGNIYLWEIDWIARHAKVSLFIGEPADRSQGYGTTALCLLIRHAFRDLGLQRVYALILEENAASLRMCEKCGFVVEGRLRRHAYKEGTWKDALLVGLLATDLPQEASR